MARPVKVSITADLVCPWGYIIKRELEIASKKANIPILIKWEPYLLSKDVAEDGIPVRDFIIARFGPAMVAHSKRRY